MNQIEIIRLGYNGSLMKGSILDDRIIVQKIGKKILLTVKKKYARTDSGLTRTIKKTFNVIKFFKYHPCRWSRYEHAIKQIIEKRNELYKKPTCPAEACNHVIIKIDNDKEISITEINHNAFANLEYWLFGFLTMPIEILKKL